MVVQTANSTTGPQGILCANLKARTFLRGTRNAQLIHRVKRGMLIYRHSHHACTDGLTIALFGQNVHHGHVLQNLHVRELLHCSKQRTGNLLARDIGVIANARARMGAFARKVELARRSALKVSPQSHQVVNHRTARANHSVYALTAILKMPRTQCVVEKRLVVLPFWQHADTTLREHRIALVYRALREHDHARIRW